MSRSGTAAITMCLIQCSCINPTSSIRSDVEQFKKDHAQQIQNFSGKNRSMQYAWSGDKHKRPLVFVHGSPGSWEGWTHFLSDVELQKKFHLLAIDRPGFGGSDPGKTEISLTAQASQIIEVLKFNESHLPAILVGHSFGGPVIARMAMDYPEQIAGLVFVASSVSPDLESIKWFQYPATWWPIRVLIPTDLRVCNEEIFPLKSELQMMLPMWKNISAKSAIIQGGKDDLVPPANLDFLLAQLRPETVVKVIRVADLNHFIPWNRPDLIVDGIMAVNQALPEP